MAEVQAALRCDPLMNSIRPASTQREKQGIVEKETTAYRRHVGQTSARLRNHVKYFDGLKVLIVLLQSQPGATSWLPGQSPCRSA
jgi:hypothetical protein